jgi:oxalate decarboxylase/phosphoglucose isomerase-like protein (cupin superfamily)
MKLSWTRPQTELSEVLMSPESKGPDVAYWIFSEVTPEKWENMTILTNGTYGKEYPKTYGHYHPHNTFETSKFISGDGLYMLQKKHYENDKWIDNMVDEFYLVKFEPGDEITLNDQFAHAWSNVGDMPLMVYDDWRLAHSPADYESIKLLHGMCFYIVNDNGIKFVPNKNYKNHPDPKIITAKEFQKMYPINL